MSENQKDRSEKILEEVAGELLVELQRGAGDDQMRRQSEEWLRSVGDKHPDLDIGAGLKKYYFAEAERLRERFATTDDLSTKLELGRSIETFLEKAAEVGGSPVEEEND